MKGREALDNSLVGEIVHYFIEGLDGEPKGLAAVITACREIPGAKALDTYNLYDVDLLIIDSAGDFSRAKSVRYSSLDEPGTWNTKPKPWR